MFVLVFLKVVVYSYTPSSTCIVQEQSMTSFANISIGMQNVKYTVILQLVLSPFLIFTFIVRLYFLFSLLLESNPL